MASMRAARPIMLQWLSLGAAPEAVLLPGTCRGWSAAVERVQARRQRVVATPTTRNRLSAKRLLVSYMPLAKSVSPAVFCPQPAYIRSAPAETSISHTLHLRSTSGSHSCAASLESQPPLISLRAKARKQEPQPSLVSPRAQVRKQELWLRNSPPRA
jgi:hypothetical protein